MDSQNSGFGAGDLYDLIERNFEEDLIRAAGAAEEGSQQHPDLLYGSQGLFGVDDDAPLGTPAIPAIPASPAPPPPEPRGAPKQAAPPTKPPAPPTVPSPAPGGEPAGLAAMLKMVRAEMETTEVEGDGLDSETETCPGSATPPLPASASPPSRPPRARSASCSSSSSASSSSGSSASDSASDSGADAAPAPSGDGARRPPPPGSRPALPPGDRVLQYLESVREAALARTLEAPDGGAPSPSPRAPPPAALGGPPPPSGASKRKRSRPVPAFLQAAPRTPSPPADRSSPQRRRSPPQPSSPPLPQQPQRRRRESSGAGRPSGPGPDAAREPAAGPAEPLLTPAGDPWPGSDPPPKGRVRYGGTGDSREGLWDDPEILLAAERYEAAGGPVPVYVPEMGDSGKQYRALVRLIFENQDAMSWLQNSKLSGPEHNLAQFCQKFIHAPRGHGSFITGSVANPLPHVGDAMARGDALWALPHAAASVAMSRRYDRTQKMFILQSLRRAYSDMAFPRPEGEGAPAAEPGSPPGPGPAAPSPRHDASSSSPTAGAPRSPPQARARVRDAYARVCAALGARRAPGEPGEPGAARRHPGGARVKELGDACVLACHAALEALLRLRGGAAAVPGLQPGELPTPACPPEALCGNPGGLRAAAAAIYELRDLVERARLLGPQDPGARLGDDDLRLAVRAVLVTARTVAPLVRYNPESARARASAWTLTRAALSIPSLAARQMAEAVAALPGAPRPREAAEEGEADHLPPLWAHPPQPQPPGPPSPAAHRAPSPGRGPAPAAPCASPAAARGLPEASEAASPRCLGRLPERRPRQRGKRRSEPPRPDEGTDDSEERAGAATPPAPKRRPGAPPPRALGPMPAGGPDPRGGFRRVPRGESHTPAPGEAARAAYCSPETVAELVDHPLFPEAWRPALTFDPAALATVAARRTGPPAREGARFGALAPSGPLRRRAAWMRQVPDPEDVRIVVLYHPLPGEDLLGGLPAGGAAGREGGPRWSERKGGLSALLAALGNRLLTRGSHCWAGNWTGPPDVSALNRQGVLLLSTGDLAFAGCVEYLCLRLGSARRRLIVLDAVDPEDWPADGPAVGQYHLYMRARLTPRAACAVRWPAERDLSRAVLTSGSVFGPVFFARVEAAFARLHPGLEAPRLCRAGNVAYVVETRAGERTRVPMPPRDYRQRVLPVYDGCKDMGAQSRGLAVFDPDFDEGAARSHRAANRWGLGAPLRPLYLAAGRRGALDESAAPADLLPPALREFCRVALLEPDLEAGPTVLRVGEELPARAPHVEWEPGFGARSTAVLAAGAVEMCLPFGRPVLEDDYLETDGAGGRRADVELVSERPGPAGGSGRPGAGARGPIKIEVLSDDDEGDGGVFNPYLS
ncbi:transcriptional regulator ICP4 [Equid alphaherpesvirus 3]|uniref:Transcriptional regulator ICP4 n=1 Tax=Equid alphaherpesvirus 3 TaxID=80341 RepID=A0A077B9T3_9ALPH|nr:transcriptional regulator ICP4 [Equid alphaherpesvirus 3]YP_009054983.1 transcriptional regulator ICP4 [Equid alphaherpesvirus 3]AIL02981.1 transcriptional regulator ICP4 [Equid alphaherpesvirus 3]AIL02997.1 transcriptional regulator ICP4 [Equid alphaherpesvirus 3]